MLARLELANSSIMVREVQARSESGWHLVGYTRPLRTAGDIFRGLLQGPYQNDWHWTVAW